MVMDRRASAMGGHHAGPASDLELAVDLEVPLGHHQFPLLEALPNHVPIAGPGAQNHLPTLEGWPVAVRDLDVDQGPLPREEGGRDRDDQGSRPPGGPR